MPPEDRPATEERRQTDESLRAERVKADGDLQEKQAAIDAAADAIIEKARARADQLLAASRAQSDGALAQHHSPSARAMKERSRADRTLREERAFADQKLRNERARLLPAPSVERDLTDQDLSQERDRADSALESRDAFLAIVSHDLRNLLAGMVGYAAGIANGVSGETHGDQVVRYAQRIQRTGGRMSRLVGDLVDVASVEAGMLAVSREEADPTLVVAEAVEHFQLQAEAKGIALTTEFASPLPSVTFDPARILQVLVNLLSNSIKFTPAGGEVIVRAEGVDDELSFAVVDTGEGIPQAKLEAVFDRYLQVTERDRRGMGLGLFISKCIVQGHGGRIWAESTLGTGSTFRFTLPPIPTDAGGSPPTDAAGPTAATAAGGPSTATDAGATELLAVR